MSCASDADALAVIEEIVDAEDVAAGVADETKLHDVLEEDEVAAEVAAEVACGPKLQDVLEEDEIAASATTSFPPKFCSRTLV